jgi:hypothetical protein
MEKAHYTEKQLLKFAIKDLIADIRFSDRLFAEGMKRNDDEYEYYWDCRQKVYSLFANRNGKLRFDKYGYPIN